MSWDIFVLDFPRDTTTVEDVPEGFSPASLGKRSTIISRIEEVVPTANFSNLSWGLIDGDGWSIEVNIGDSEDCKGFVFHVRGGDEAVGVVAAVLQHLDLRAFDAQTGDFFVAGQEAVESFRKWRAYRDRVVADLGRDPAVPPSTGSGSGPLSKLRSRFLAWASKWPSGRPSKKESRPTGP
jgi:hypothetical protein